MNQTVKNIANPRRPAGGFFLPHVALGGAAIKLALVVLAFVAGAVIQHHRDASYFRAHYNVAAERITVPTTRAPIPVFPRVGTQPAAASIKLRAYPAVGDQGTLGACAAWASAWALSYEYRMTHPHNPGIRFSPRYLYDHYANTYNNGLDMGSWPDGDLETAQTTGIPQYNAFHYPPFRIDATIPANVQANAAKHRFGVSVQTLSNDLGGGPGAVDAIKAAILQNHPVLFGLPVWPEYDASTGYIDAPTPAELKAQPTGRGGHENVILGYNDSIVFPSGAVGGFLIQNQWGTLWGNAGRSWISYAMAERYFFGIKILKLGGVSAGYIPSPTTLNVTHVTGIISSSYWWEAGTLGSPPVEDTDYIHPYGYQETVRLPGTHSMRYSYYQSGFIPGSGYYLTVQAPNGGRFAFFHLVSLRYGLTMTGGYAIGVSGWPLDPVYGNGLAGPANSHLCFVADALGADWLYHVATYVPPNPTPAFPASAWHHYTAVHHKRAIPYRERGRLTWAASVWLGHRSLGGVRDAGTWHAGKPGYTKTRFEHRSLYCFPATHRCKVA